MDPGREADDRRDTQDGTPRGSKRYVLVHCFVRAASEIVDNPKSSTDRKTQNPGVRDMTLIGTIRSPLRALSSAFDYGRLAACVCLATAREFKVHMKHS